MHDSADAALLSTTSGSLGYWVGGFILPMIFAFVLLRFAGSTRRRPRTALVLRSLAIILAAVVVWLGYTGSGGIVNPGGILALGVVLAWAAKQQFTRVAA